MTKRVCHKHGLGERSYDALMTNDMGIAERKPPASVTPAKVPSAQATLFA